MIIYPLTIILNVNKYRLLNGLAHGPKHNQAWEEGFSASRLFN
jgi:hypothetical protein